MRLISDEAIAVATIFQEAEGEAYEGKVAVGEVILTRTREKYMSDGTIIGTCLHAYQFSAWMSNAPNRIRSLKIDDTDPIVQDCQRAWQEAQGGSVRAKGAVLYYNPKIITTPPTWANPDKYIVTIGQHDFFSA